jgi:ABC-type transport system involved in multi-copper enzyme maturation permease subunit
MKLLTAELLKLRTTPRSLVGFVILVVAVGALGAAVTIGGTPADERGAPTFDVDLVGSTEATVLVAILLGITLVTREWRHGTITPTFLATPRRERVTVAKLAAAGVVGFLVAVLALVVVLVVAIPWLTAIDEPFDLTGEVRERMGLVVTATVLWGLLGAAIGSLVHSQVGATLGTILWFLLIEPLARVGLDLLDTGDAAGYLPGSVLSAAAGRPDESLSVSAGITGALAYVVVIGAAGIVRTGRRDVT